MKKHIKSVLLLLGFVVLYHPLLAEASSDVVNQKSEVVEQTNISVDDINALIEKNKELVDNYNQLVDDYIEKRNEYNSISINKDIIITSFDKEKYAEVESLQYINNDSVNISQTSILRKIQSEYNLINDSLIQEYILLEDVYNKTYIKVEKEKKEIARIEEEKKIEANRHAPTGPHLTKSGGVFYGPNGKETYYNLNMSGIISIMRSRGNNDEYWIREDGVKMLGNYVMIAANLSVYPRGSLVETSLGIGIVCDTGGFVHNGSGVAFDIATAW